MDREVPTKFADGDARTATIIEFPLHRLKPRTSAASATATPTPPATLPVRAVSSQTKAADIEALAVAAVPERAAGTTTLAALGAVAGFAAQQSLLLQGSTSWGQPMRAAHLDRLLVSTDAADASLWHRLEATAKSVSHARLPDPARLLAATQRCVGTNQLGVITLPPQHRLDEQPQTGLIRLWAHVREGFEDTATDPRDWPCIAAEAAVAHVRATAGKVPIHVAVRIVMQAALGMALIEPRQIPGAAIRTA